jgi:hypothetical protein
MLDALYQVHESIKAMKEKPEWMSRVVAALEDKEPWAGMDIVISLLKDMWCLLGLGLYAPRGNKVLPKTISSTTPSLMELRWEQMRARSRSLTPSTERFTRDYLPS